MGLASVSWRMAGLMRHVSRWMRLVRLRMWLVSLPMGMCLWVRVWQRV